MENKNVGWLIIGIALSITIIIFIFNNAMTNIVGQTCSHGPTCTMYDTIKTQTWLSLSIVAVVFVIGLVIMFSKPKEKIVVKTIKEKKKKLNLSGLDKDDKKVVDLLLSENKAMFQSDLMEKLKIGKVKTTRLLNRLEDKGMIERKRRGMNNIVVLKD
ncbi:MAG: MarR family transcriptional regulator [Nanoarchaeota archaeon]